MPQVFDLCLFFYFFIYFFINLYKLVNGKSNAYGKNKSNLNNIRLAVNTVVAHRDESVELVEHILNPYVRRSSSFLIHSFSLNCCLSRTHMHTHIDACTPGGKAEAADGVMCVLGSTGRKGVGGLHVRS